MARSEPVSFDLESFCEVLKDKLAEGVARVLESDDGFAVWFQWRGESLLQFSVDVGANVQCSVLTLERPRS